MKKILFIAAILIGFLGSAQDSIVTEVSLKGRKYKIVGGGSATTDASLLTSGVLADARVQQSNVTQHQAALSITESQISDFGDYAGKATTTPRDPVIWGPGTKAEFYSDYPWPSTGFPSNGIAFITDSIRPSPTISLDSLVDVTMGNPASNSSGTLRVLADPNEDGTYTEVDWTPPGGGSGLNADEFRATVIGDLTNPANANKTAYIQNNITLTGNATLASGITLKNTGGYIILDGNTLTGSNTGFIADDEKPIIDCQTGTISGTWNAPDKFYATNFGAVADGEDHRTVFTIDKSGTGSITSGSTTLTVSDANFTSDRIGQNIVVMLASSTGEQNALVTTIASITNSTTVVLSDAATQTASNVRVFYGADNYNAIHEALKVRNQKSGKLIFPQGHYMTSTIMKPFPISNPQDGFLVGNGTNGVSIEGYGATVQTFPYDWDAEPSNQRRTVLFDLYRTIGSEIKGMHLVGAYFSSLDFSEYPAGINFGTGAFKSRVIDCDITEFQGDGLVSYGDPQFEGGIQGTNQVTVAFDTGVSIGRLLSDGTTDAAQTDYTYSTDLVLINGGNYDDFSEVAGYGSFMLTGDGFSGWSGVATQDYEAAIYDENDDFVVFLSGLILYEEVRIQARNWKKIRIGLKDVPDRAEVNLRMRCDFNAHDTYIENTNAYYNGRQGASNLTSDTWWNGGNIHNNGGVSPGYGIDFEDHRRNARNIRLTNLTFWDNYAGDLALIGPENVLIENCSFLGSTRPDWGSSIGINGQYARELQIRDCYFKDKNVGVARGATLSGLQFNGGTLRTSAAGVTISDIHMVQGKIIVDALNTDGHNRANNNPVIQDVTIRMYKEFDYILSDRNVLGQWKNIKIYLNDASTVSNLIDETDLNASFGPSQVLWEEVGAVGGQPYGGGYIDGFTVQGHTLAHDASATASYARFPQFEWTRDIKVDHGITLGYYGDGAVDLLWENLECKFLDLDARHGDYLTSVPGDPIANPAPVWTFKNAKIHNNVGDFNISNLNFRQLEIEDFWLDVVFDGGELINDAPYSATLNRSRFLNMDNYGSVTFKNGFTFGNNGNEGGTVVNDIILTNTWFRASGRTYPVAFEDVNLIYGTSITPSSDDYVAFTRANPLMATYAIFADDAAASTGNYPTGFIYMTATGELRIKL